jgi:glyoxylase-like metal-dependent hydrolase (beta-lactamase superfamily II)
MTTRPPPWHNPAAGGCALEFVQYYLDCLSQASYLIGDETTGRAAVVDPRRDVQDYLDDAAASGLSIDYVIETHVHADFLSGHLELAAATGAAIVYGEVADVHFPHRKVADGERIQLGQVGLEFRATPGHTPESVCIVVWESPRADAPYGVLTGDTLSTEKASTIGEQRRSNYALRLAPPRTSWPRSPRDSRPSPATSPGWPNSTGNPTGSRTSRSRRC